MVIKVGNLVRRLDRSGLWLVLEVAAGRAYLRPVSDVWTREPRWVAIDDLVKSNP